MSGLIPYDVDTKFWKRHDDAKYIDKNNKQLADQRTLHMGKDEKPVTADDISADVSLEKEDAVRAMLRKYEPFCSGQLGEINSTKMYIDLVPDVKPLKSARYRTGLKTRKLERSKSFKQLKAGIIEPAMKEWAPPVLFVPKKDGKVRFCIDYMKVNSMAITDTYHLQRMDECIDTLGDAEYLTTLDVYSGY